MEYRNSLMRRLWPYVVLFTAVILLYLIATADAGAHYKPGTHNAVHAINLAFCGRSNATCQDGHEAVRVVKCEAGKYWYMGYPHFAHNGQYLGMFQMGSWERRIYGHGPDPWKQAFAAYRYFIASGHDWSPWECKP